MKAGSKKILMWALILGGAYLAWKKMGTAPRLSGLGGAYPDSQAAMYPPGSGSTY